MISEFLFDFLFILGTFKKYFFLLLNAISFKCVCFKEFLSKSKLKHD